MLACFFGASATLLGAFGAHVLKSQLAEHQLQMYETGVRYQFYHTFALMVAAWLYGRGMSSLGRSAAWLFVTGVSCFSGSLYVLALRDVLGIPSAGAYIGWITPVGGTLLIVGWIMLFEGFRRFRPSI
ncbi:MAG: hypothetical protein RLY31_2821 [Bacteroidota bacterium]